MLRVDNNHEKEYHVTVDKLINEDFVKKMQGGVPILGVVTRKCEVVKTGTHSFNIILRQGLNRQIRRMCEYLGYNVVRLERIRIMHIKLGNIKVGQWRNITKEELEILRKKTASSVKTESAPKKKTKPQETKTPQTKGKSANSYKEKKMQAGYKEGGSGMRNGKSSVRKKTRK